MIRSRLLCLIFIILLASASTLPQAIEETVTGHRIDPSKKEFNEALLSRLNVPDGFKINVFAKGLRNPRMMAVNADGSVFVTRPKQEDVIILKDSNGDGVSDQMETAASGLKVVHGVSINKNKLYLATDKEIYVSTLNGNSVSKPEMIISDLPDGGQHPNRTLGFGPDGMMYISVGSSCNACEETNKEHATILRASADGKSREIFATGLRNTIGFGWHPQTKVMWGMDHGSDFRGDDLPPEELNRLEKGNNYGWPFCYGEKVKDVMSGKPEKTTLEDFCSKSTGAVLTYQAHSAPIGMVFYNAAQFPEEYRGDAFIAMRGSWNRKPPTGYKIVRLSFNDEGEPEGFEDFLTGFLLEDENQQFARPAGVAVLNDGSLLLSDDTNGVIYRISYSNE